MKKAEILRSGPAFRRTLLQGERIEGKLLRCHYLVHQAVGPPLQVGLAVSSRHHNAVRRNRLRRLLREAVSMEKGTLDNALKARGECAQVVFSFKGRTSVSVDRCNLHIVRVEIAALCQSLTAKLSSE